MKCGDHPFMSSTKSDGTKVGLFATVEMLRKTPKWNPEAGEPPISISHAVSEVKRWAKSFYSRFDDIEVDRISLSENVCWEVKGRWLYVISLTPIVDGNKLHGSSYMAAVLMDGTIIEPRTYAD